MRCKACGKTRVDATWDGRCWWCARGKVTVIRWGVWLVSFPVGFWGGYYTVKHL